MTPSHWLVLQRVEKELQCLIGSLLVHVATFRKDELVLLFHLPDGTERAVVCSLHPRYSALYLLPKGWKLPVRRVKLFQQYLPAVVQHVRAVQYSRQFRFDFPDFRIELLFYGKNERNAWIVDSSGQLLTAFFKPEGEVSTEMFSDVLRLRKWEDIDGECTILKALASERWCLGRSIAREILLRAGVEPEMTVGNLCRERRASVDAVVAEYREQWLRSTTVYIYQTQHRDLPIVSMLPLQQEVTLLQVVEGISAGIRTWVRLARELDEVQYAKRRLTKLVETRHQKITCALEKLSESNLQKQAEQYQYWGDLLLSQPEPYQKGLGEITVTGWNGEQIQVKLNPEENLVQNAERYYRKAKSIREKLRVWGQKRHRLLQQQQRLEKQRRAVTQIQTLRDVAQLCKEYPEFRTILDQSESGRSHKALPFRIFSLGEYGTVGVGKDAKSNDFLTLRWAKPDDYWFHTRDCPGSHVVFKPYGSPPQKILHLVAALAAYYSANRFSSSVPVIMTKRKYVRKRKQMPAGSVRVEKEEVLIVRPLSPDEILGLLGE